MPSRIPSREVSCGSKLASHAMILLTALPVKDWASRRSARVLLCDSAHFRGQLTCGWTLGAQTLRKAGRAGRRLGPKDAADRKEKLRELRGVESVRC